MNKLCFSKHNLPKYYHQNYKKKFLIFDVSGNTKVAGTPLPYDDLASLRKRMSEISPTLTNYGRRESASFGAESLKLLASKSASSEPLRAWLHELSQFYTTNPISRSSKTMAECVKSFEQKSSEQQKPRASKQQQTN